MAREIVLGKRYGKQAGRTFDFPDNYSNQDINREIRKELNLSPDFETTLGGKKMYGEDRSMGSKFKTAMEGVGQKITGGLQGVGQQFGAGQQQMLAETSRLLGVPSGEGQEEAPEARGIPQHIARLVGELSAPVGGIPGAGIPAGAIKGLLRTRKAYPAIKRAVGVPGKILKEGAAFIGEMATSVPRENITKLMGKKLPSIFNKDEYELAIGKVGERAQRALKFVNIKAGRAVRKEKNLLKEIGKKDLKIKGKNLDSYIDEIEDKRDEFRTDLVDLFSNKDEGMLKKIKSVLKPPSKEGVTKSPTVRDFQFLKTKIQRFVKYNQDKGITPASADAQPFFQIVD